MTSSQPTHRLVGVILVLGFAGFSAPSYAQPNFGDDSSQWAKDGECDDPRFQGEGSAETLLDADSGHDATDCRKLFGAGRIALRSGSDTTAAADGVHRGRLQKGDETLNSGEYSDSYTFTGSSGQRAVVDLRSGDFDPYVFVRAPGGEQFDNDDYEGDSSRSLLSLDLTEDGEYAVTVTSYRKGEAGDYTLVMNVGSGGPAPARMDRSGTLQTSDSTLSSGEFVDSYEFEGWPGQHVVIDLRSSAFDTYLILRDPAGEQTENDDTDDGGNGHSNIETDLTETGTYRVLVTSYDKGETGGYQLSINPSAADETRSPANRDVTTLTVGRPQSGELENGDQELDTGEFRDVYVFDGNEGQNVRIELSSDAFDTYVGLVTPSEEAIENDDFEGASDRSVIEMTLPETGRYRVVATSYAAAETGQYRLALSTRATPMPVEQRAGGRVYGIFAGISDYPGDGDLQYTAEDATRIRDALLQGGGMRSGDAYTFVDSEATVGNISNAIRNIAGRIQPEDTFVMFYSGHGGRLPRSGGADSADPDGLDETLALYDGAMRDDELRTLFDSIHAGTTLLWLDSCFSGGFAKDIVSAPGRMGVFSSEEDVTSQVAEKFRAGGYLSAFLDEGIAQGQADEDNDDSITAIELSQYLHERFRSDVKGSSSGDDIVMTGGRTMGFQHLVIDRGSIGPFDVLFKR